MMKVLFSLSLLCSGLMASFEWRLQITKPNFDLENIKLTEKNYRPFLPKTGWRCWFGQTELKNEIHSKEIKCNFSVKKTGQFITGLSCSKERPYSEIHFDLLDERKNLTYKFLITCRKAP